MSVAIGGLTDDEKAALDASHQHGHAGLLLHALKYPAIVSAAVWFLIFALTGSVLTSLLVLGGFALAVAVNFIGLRRTLLA
jgi:uncharacterized membrane protein